MQHARALQQQAVALTLDLQLLRIEARQRPALPFTRGPDLLLYGFTFPSARHDFIITVTFSARAFRGPRWTAERLP